MKILITMLSDIKDSMKIIQKKEMINVFGICAEIFGDAFISFIPRILNIFFKQIIFDPQMHSTIAETIGLVIREVFKNVENVDESCSHILNIIKTVFGYLSKPDFHFQVGVAMSITKIVQNTPLDILFKLLNQITEMLLENLSSPQIKAKSQLLECLICLVLAIEDKFEPFASNFLPVLRENINNKDSNTRKVCIDVLYAFAAFIPAALSINGEFNLNDLKKCLKDPDKNVADSAADAISKIKQSMNIEQKNSDSQEIEMKPKPQHSKKQNIINIVQKAKIPNQISNEAIQNISNENDKLDMHENNKKRNTNKMNNNNYENNDKFEQDQFEMQIKETDNQEQLSNKEFEDQNEENKINVLTNEILNIKEMCSNLEAHSKVL